MAIRKWAKKMLLEQTRGASFPPVGVRFTLAIDSPLVFAVMALMVISSLAQPAPSYIKTFFSITIRVHRACALSAPEYLKKEGPFLDNEARRPKPLDIMAE